jgi:hypothetical protein
MKPVVIPVVTDTSIFSRIFYSELDGRVKMHCYRWSSTSVRFATLRRSKKTTRFVQLAN